MPSLCLMSRCSPALVARTSSARKERLQKLFSFDGKLTQDLIDGFARSIQKNNSLFQLLLGMAKMITALKGDNSFFSFFTYIAFFICQPAEARSETMGRKGRRACSIFQRSPRLLGTSPIFQKEHYHKTNITINRKLEERISPCHGI